MLVAPCKDCRDRELGCHSKCIKYMEFKKQQDALNKQRREEYINQYTPPTKRIRKIRGGN